MPQPFPYRFITGLPKQAQHEIWRNLTALAAAIGSSGAIFFHQTGNVVVSPSTVAKAVPVACARLNVTVTLGAAGTSSTVVTLYKNGGSIGTVTLVSADDLQTATITSAFNGTTDQLTAKVTTAGTGAQELLVQVVPE